MCSCHATLTCSPARVTRFSAPSEAKSVSRGVLRELRRSSWFALVMDLKILARSPRSLTAALELRDGEVGGAVGFLERRREGNGTGLVESPSAFL